MSEELKALASPFSSQANLSAWRSNFLEKKFPAGVIGYVTIEAIKLNRIIFAKNVFPQAPDIEKRLQRISPLRIRNDI